MIDSEAIIYLNWIKIEDLPGAFKKLKSCDSELTTHSFYTSSKFINKEYKSYILTLVDSNKDFVNFINKRGLIFKINMSRVESVEYNNKYYCINFLNKDRLEIDKKDLVKSGLINLLEIKKVLIEDKILKNILPKEEYLKFLIRKEL